MNERECFIDYARTLTFKNTKYILDEFMAYEWDEEKNFENFIKHRIWFEEAQVIWVDENAIEFYDDEHSVSEDRWIRIGANPKKGILLVVFCERKNGESIRIISARDAVYGENGLRPCNWTNLDPVLG